MLSRARRDPLGQKRVLHRVTAIVFQMAPPLVFRLVRLVRLLVRLVRLVRPNF
jgi:hypothetical protein